MLKFIAEYLRNFIIFIFLVSSTLFLQEEELKKMEKKAETCAKKINPNISEKGTYIKLMFSLLYKINKLFC